MGQPILQALVGRHYVGFSKPACRSHEASRSPTMSNEVIAAIVGALIGAACTYGGAVCIANRQFRHLLNVSRVEAARVAAARFRAAFSRDLAVLESGLSLEEELQTFLLAGFKARHAEAIVSYEPFVRPERTASFHGDWLRYCYGARPNGVPLSPDEVLMSPDSLLFLEYNDESHLANPELPRKLAIEQIRKLLSHARET